VLSNLIDVQAAAGWRAESSIAALDASRPCGFWATSLRGPVLGGPVLGGTVLGGTVLGGTVLGGTVLGGTVLGGINALGVARSHAAQGSLMPWLPETSGQTWASSKQDTRKKYQHATRAAALGGSATGSHPVSWDPV
jgi:hypothetical protein